ncbi:hypothetical protein ACOSQ2_018811 [Xanthoceras sorbifolium]
MKVRPPQGEIRGTITRSETEKMRLHKELEAARRKARAYKEELPARTEFKKELAEKANRCQVLQKEIDLKMNASAAKYKDQICVLKDKIKRAKADL